MLEMVSIIQNFDLCNSPYHITENLMNFLVFDNINKHKASPLWGASNIEHTSILIEHIHTQENTETKIKKQV